MPIVPADHLITLGERIFRAAGAPEDIARAVAVSLVGSDLRGHASHGIIQALKYVGKIRSGHLNPQARPEVAGRSGAVALIDCGWGFGQVAAQFGAGIAGEMADQFGIGCACLQRVNHIARLGEYAEILARSGYVGIVLTSGAAAGGSVAAFGGRERIFGTNPMAWAVPVPDSRPPLVADFATSGSSLGKLDIAIGKGEAIPPGLLLDRDARPSTDPEDFGRGGVLLPFGGYKGYGLLLMLEIIPTILAGFAPATSREYQPGNPTLIFALRIETFTTTARFRALSEELLDRIKRSAPAPGCDEVLLPGEPEARALERHQREGVPIPDPIWKKLTDLAGELGAALP